MNSGSGEHLRPEPESRWPLGAQEDPTTWSSTASGLYWGCLSSLDQANTTVQLSLDAASRSEAKAAKASSCGTATGRGQPSPRLPSWP